MKMNELKERIENEGGVLAFFNNPDPENDPLTLPAELRREASRMLDALWNFEVILDDMCDAELEREEFEARKRVSIPTNPLEA